MAITVTGTATTTAAAAPVPDGVRGTSYRIENRGSVTLYRGGAEESVDSTYASLAPGQAEVVPDVIDADKAPVLATSSSSAAYTITIYQSL